MHWLMFGMSLFAFAGSITLSASYSQLSNARALLWMFQVVIVASIVATLAFSSKPFRVFVAPFTDIGEALLPLLIMNTECLMTLSIPPRKEGLILHASP